MKANKIFAALAALTLGFAACTPTEEVEMVLSDSQIVLEVGATHQLTANVKVESWETSNAEVATVADGLILAVSEGTTIISAKAGAQSKSCVVKVNKKTSGGGEGGDGAKLPYKRVWAVLMDQVTYDANASIIVCDARVDDVENNLWVWASGETYAAGEAVGKNAFGNDEGYLAMTCVAPDGWSGMGFCVEKETSVAGLEELRQAILANPDNFFFHIAMKSTDNASHNISFFNDAAFFSVGTTEIDEKPIFCDFVRDGKWHEIDVPMASYTSVLKTFNSGDNIVCTRSGAQVGAQLNLDAIFFYEK
ncbi:MAG: hypothetical protein KBS77_00830 [Bacteroidales bacterium]|nr:hypothetical protein [Candidatus Colicola faecequi]